MTREPEVALFAALCLGAVGCSSAVEGRADGGSTDGQDGSTSMSPEPEPSSSDATSGGSSDGSDPTT